MDTVAAPAVPSSSVPALLARLGTARWPVVIDVRREPARAASPWRLPAALRCPPESIDDAPAWLPADAVVVCACVHGHEVSQRAAATLRALGVDASYLEGGVEGWRDAGGPLRRADAAIDPPAHGGSLWVAHAPARDGRIACAWLVRRFVDPLARIAWLPGREVAAFAARTGAIAFDRGDGTGDDAGDPFDALLRAAGLEDDTLRRMAAVVRGADDAGAAPAPESAGLGALSRGLSRLHDDDRAVPQAGLALYDALHAALRPASGGAAR